jgi:hypothetical protein
MLAQSLAVQEALPINEKVAPEKPSHHTSIFGEIDDVPGLWGRES